MGKPWSIPLCDKNVGLKSLALVSVYVDKLRPSQQSSVTLGHFPVFLSWTSTKQRKKSSMTQDSASNDYQTSK